MNINIMDKITLSDSIKYSVISKTIFENKKYYFLMDENDHDNFKYCFEQNDLLIEIEDEKILKIIVPKLFDEIKNFI